MQKLILTSPGVLELTQGEIPRPGPQEIIIQTAACNLCKTDLKCYESGQRDLALPRVLGHELAGTVYSRGEAVTEYDLGERVYVHPGIPCGHCDYCLDGRDSLCDAIKIIGFNLDGGFQEYLTLPGESHKSGGVMKLPDQVSFAAAAFIEPLACCLNMQRKMSLRPEHSLLIIGGGRLGILNMRTAKALGLEKIFLIEPDAKRRVKGKALGFTEVFAGEVEAWEQLTNVDTVIPCCPDPAAFAFSLDILAKGGVLGFFSGLVTGENISPNLNLIHYKELTVTGSYGCNIADSKSAQALLADGSLIVEDLIENRISLAEVEEGLLSIKERSALSTLVCFDQEEKKN